MPANRFASADSLCRSIEVKRISTRHKDICTQYTKSSVEIDINFVLCGVDKCAPVRYNVSTFKKEVHEMTAFATAKSSYCTNSAAVSTSAHNMEILDTVILAVSILLIPNICIVRT